MLRHGKSTPRFVESTLSVFGNNPHGQPNYRLIWSERKMIHFCGEICPEYAYLPYPGWVLEAWISPEKDAGPPEQWQRVTRGLLGPYPTEGTYNFVKQYPRDWTPTEENARIVCVGLIESKDVSMKARVDAIRANKEAENAAARQKVADEIVELQDSASRGLITQPASGKKNNFRTTDDYQRDMERGIAVDLPLSGGKIY
jgi:hypothetical protein